MSERAYLSTADFKAWGGMPGADVDALEVAEPGTVSAALLGASAEVDGKLRKRYLVPLADPVPNLVKVWVGAIATLTCFEKRGWNPGDKLDENSVAGRARVSREALAQAADPANGLLELPLRSDAAETSGVAVGDPLGRADADPYSWIDRQRDARR